VLNRIKLLCALLGVLSFPASVFADSFTFSLIPSNGTISGIAGSTIGWGYSITNNSSADWLVPVNLTSSPFADGTPDATPFDFPIVAPGATTTEAYDMATDMGLFALTWDSNAPTGFTNIGVFTLSAEWWSGDPTVAGTFIADADDTTASYSASVSPSSVPPAVPEPASFVLVFGGMLALRSMYRNRVLSPRRL
jgi:hypothetical protein